MAVVSISDAARLAEVSRQTLYDKINAGELSRTSTGIDTSELARVFPDLKPLESVKIKDVKKESVREKSAEGQGGDVEYLKEQLAWFRELADRREEQVTQARRQLDEKVEEYNQQLQQKDEFWSRQVTQMQALLPAPVPNKRKKILGIF